MPPSRLRLRSSGTLCFELLRRRGRCQAVRGHSTGSTRGAHGRHRGGQGCVGTQAPGQAARAGSEGPTRRSHRPRWCPVCTQAWCWDTGEPGERTLTYFLNSRPTTGGRDKPEWGVGQDLLSAGRTSAAERLPGQGGETGERWARHPLLWACLRQRPPLHSPPGAKEQAQRVRRSCSPTSRKRGTQGSAGHWLASQLTGR